MPDTPDADALAAFARDLEAILSQTKAMHMDVLARLDDIGATIAEVRDDLLRRMDSIDKLPEPP